MTTANFKLVLVGGLVAAGVVLTVVYNVSKPGKADEKPKPLVAANRSAPAGKPTGRLASPAPPAPGPAIPTEYGSESGPFKLTPQQVEDYLARNNRTADTLLSAFLASQDPKYLQEAAERFPHDPRIQLKVLTSQLFPESRRQWLERFKQSSPNNALPFYLSASDYLKQGKAAEGLQEFMTANSRKEYNDFSREYIQNLEEVCQASGLSSLLAKAAAMQAVGLDHLAPMRSLGREIRDYRKRYLDGGDDGSAELLANAGLQFGQHLSEGYGGMTLINQLVGIAIESTFLAELDPNTSYPAIGKTVQQRKEELAQRRQELKDLAKEATGILASGNEEDVNNYFSRFKISGEQAAMRWFREKNK
jgi:hypothetical protein